jgi:hypothetical protein
MKKSIIFYSLDKRDTTSFWRFLSLKYIEHEEFNLTDISDTKVFDWTTFASHDILLLQRPFCVEHHQVLTAAKSMGLRIILDYDDNLLDIDMYNPTYSLYKQNQSTIIQCLKLADEIWTSTESIKQAYLPHNSNIHVILNAHNDYLFPIKNKRPFGANKKCIYRGGSSHQADVNSVANQLIKVINDNKSHTFTFMGDRYTYLEMNCGDNYHIVGGMHLMDYFRFLNNENPSAMIFPLCNTKFNSGKSNISVLEGTYSGAAFFGNKALPEFNHEWILPIEELGDKLNDTDLLHMMHNFAWEWILGNLLLSDINKLRTERLLANL